MSATNDIRIEQVTSEADIPGFWECMYQAFGVQTNDAFMAALHPQMHTPEGYRSDVARLINGWRKDQQYNSTTKFWLKATVPSSTSPAERRIVGVTIWNEALQDRNPPSNDADASIDLEAIYPGNEREQSFVRQVYASLYGYRKEVVREAGIEGRPVLILDLCCVHPEFQQKGISRKLVQWGLDYARRQGEFYGGTLECYTEASVMGRPAYERMGFKAHSEVVYVVDDEFKDRRTAPNTHLRRPKGLVV